MSTVQQRRIARMKQVVASRMMGVQVALEAVHHRHNVSAILRTADSLGLHVAHLVRGESFHAVNGASRGAERWMDIFVYEEPAQAIKRMKSQGMRVFVADIDETAVTPEAIPVDEPLVIWMGAELAGVSPEASAVADGVISLPMYGFSQSLNVSVAAAMILSTVAGRYRAHNGAKALLSKERQAEIVSSWVSREENRTSSVRKSRRGGA